MSCAAPSALCSLCQAAWQGKGMDRTLLSKHCRRHESCQFWTGFPASYQASSQQTAAQHTAMCTPAFLCLTALPWMALVKAFPWAPLSRCCRDHHHHHQFTRLTVLTPAETQACFYIQHTLKQLSCVTENEISFSGQAYRSYNLVFQSSGSLDFCYFKVLSSSIVNCILKGLNHFQEILSLYTSR